MTLQQVSVPWTATSIANAIALSVANIDSPTELGSIAGVISGELRLCYQAVAGANEWTLYAWDSTSSASANSPYLVNGSSGQWVAMTGKYTNGNALYGNSLTVAGSTNGGIALWGSSLSTSTRVADGSLTAPPTWITGTTQQGYGLNYCASVAATVGLNGFAARPGLVAGSFTCAQVTRFYANVLTIGAGAACTTSIGFCNRPNGNATNNFGFLHGLQTTAVTGAWAFYNDTTDASWLGGALTVVGTSTFAGINATSIGATTRGTIAGTTGDFNSTLTAAGVTSVTNATQAGLGTGAVTVTGGAYVTKDFIARGNSWIVSTGATANLFLTNTVAGAVLTGAHGFNIQMDSLNANLVNLEAGLFSLWTSNTERLRITALGSVCIGTTALSTSATDGFLYVNSCAGTPTGVPTTQTGRIPVQFDSTNNFLYAYLNGAWKKTTVFS